MKITSLDQLTRRVVEETFFHPSTGEEYTIDLKELLPSEINAFLYMERTPEPPIKDVQKNTYTGRPEPVFDYEDLGYKRGLANHNNRFVLRWILAAVTFDVPGDNEAEKIKNLEEALPGWVVNEFRLKLEELGGVRESEIALAKKKSKLTA